MEAAFSILALLFVLIVFTGGYVTLKLLAAARRGVDRTVVQARRTVEDSTLWAKQLAQPGAVAELAKLRLKLRASMRATQETLQAGGREDPSLSEALGLFERLSAHGHELDDELKRLEREPDKIRLTAQLPELRDRTELITHSADSLRWAARDRARQFADDDLDMLGRQIQVETGALRHWTPGPGPDTPQSERETRQTGEVGRPGPRSSSPRQPSRPAAANEPPPAIIRRDPRQQTTHRWEKVRRPESTG
jgi:hypothetical protein